MTALDMSTDETLASLLHDAKTELVALRLENSLLREAGGLVLIGLTRGHVCLLCGAEPNRHRALCPARALADLLSEKP